MRTDDILKNYGNIIFLYAGQPIQFILACFYAEGNFETSKQSFERSHAPHTSLRRWDNQRHSSPSSPSLPLPLPLSQIKFVLVLKTSEGRPDAHPSHRSIFVRSGWAATEMIHCYSPVLHLLPALILPMFMCTLRGSMTFLTIFSASLC